MVIYEKQEKKNRALVSHLVKSYKSESKPIVRSLVKKGEVKAKW
jgi:hypothetical protein